MPADAAPELTVVPNPPTDDLAAIVADWAVPPAEMVGQLPKLNCKACSDSQSKHCDRHTKARCNECGNWISTAHVHLDYVGHAEVTRILLGIDPAWSWEPVAWADDGGPMVRNNNGTAELWIRLTVLGVTRLGVGTCPANKLEASKELIGDALRNAAMRFGIALSLWSKEEWSEDDTPSAPPADEPPADPPMDGKRAKGWLWGVLTEELGLPADDVTRERATALWDVHGPAGDGPWPTSVIAAVIDEARREVEA